MGNCLSCCAKSSRDSVCIIFPSSSIETICSDCSNKILDTCPQTENDYPVNKADDSKKKDIQEVSISLVDQGLNSVCTTNSN